MTLPNQDEARYVKKNQDEAHHFCEGVFYKRLGKCVATGEKNLSNILLLRFILLHNCSGRNNQVEMELERETETKIRHGYNTND